MVRLACSRLLLTALVTPLVVGLVPASAQQGEVSTIEIQIGDNMRFTPSVIEARPGQRLRVVLTSVAKTGVRHNFVLLKKGTNTKTFLDKVAAPREPDFAAAGMQDRVIASTPLIGSGTTRETTFDAPREAGEYPFLCTFQGHYNLGMRGQLTVR